MERKIMLNIGFLNFNNIKKYTPAKQSFPNKSYSNLAPLKADTVSFSGFNRLNRGLMQALANEEVCSEVSENAKNANARLTKILNTSLGDFTASKSNPKGIIRDIETRVKTPESIKEKVASEFESLLSKENPKFFNPKNSEDIKKTLGDIVGARVVLREINKKETEKIINSLIEQVKNGSLKITKIESYAPSSIPEELHYFSKKDLERLKKAANEVRPKGSREVELSIQSTKAGYMALHIDVDLSSPDCIVKNNGYRGEIQFVGVDIEQLKEVEDFCYKIKQGKDIKGGNPAYKPFVEYFRQNLKNPDYPNLESDFQECTSKAYAYQRKKPALEFEQTKKKGKKHLPTIEECEMQGKIPPELDFNKLEEMKYHCDKIYENTSNLSAA